MRGFRKPSFWEEALREILKYVRQENEHTISNADRCLREAKNCLRRRQFYFSLDFERRKVTTIFCRDGNITLFSWFYLIRRPKKNLVSRWCNRKMWLPPWKSKRNSYIEATFVRIVYFAFCNFPPNKYRKNYLLFYTKATYNFLNIRFTATRNKCLTQLQLSRFSGILSLVGIWIGIR